MTCRCDLFEPLVLRRADVEARVRATPGIRASLDLVAVASDVDGGTGQAARLYRCRSCRQLWQSGRHTSLGRREYVFQVPEISREAWLSERFCDPAELLAYAEAKRWISQTRQHGVHPTPPTGRLFFLSPDALVGSRAVTSPVSTCYVHVDEGTAPRPDAQHLESVRTAC